MLPATGSTMIAATLPCAHLRAHVVEVVVARDERQIRELGGTPAESGTLNVAPPEPAFTSSESTWP